MKRRGAENEDSSVDEQGEAESHRGIENSVTHGLAAIANRGTESARLHYAGVEIKIVRHNSGAEDTNGYVQHLPIVQNFSARDEPDDGFSPYWMGEKDFVGEAAGDGGDESDDEGLDDAKAAPLQGEDDQDIESSDSHAREQRQTEEQLESDGGAKHFRKVASGDGDFADDPKRDGSTTRVMLAASLSQVAPGGDAQLGRKRLQKHRHEVADENDAEKRIAKFRSSADVRSPVARIHVADRNEITGPGKCEHFANPRRGVGDGNGAMGLGQRGQARQARRCGGWRFSRGGCRVS